MRRYDLQFSSVLFSLLDRISQLGRDNYNEKEHIDLTCKMIFIPERERLARD
jgi:hypothetical protein